MCGIAGMIDLMGQRPAPPDVLRRMASAIIHRGPDEDGYLEKPGIGFASRRLSIVDLAGGRQPIANENQDIWVVFNGELFDFPELARNLTQCGHRLRTHCDTEILPHLWEEHGEGMFPHVRGQFAFALWDERQRSVILARDRYGICPLFWTVHSHAGGEWLIFASEIKAILASGWIIPRPDVRGIDQLFTFVGVPGPASCFEGIHTLQPGHYLRVQQSEQGRVEERIYWQIDFPDLGTPPAESQLSRLTDQFEQVLLASVRRRLRADVPVVSYLSGGIDSSLIVAMASQILGQPIRSYTVGVADPALNETSFARQVARHVGSHNVLIPYDSRRMLDYYPQLVWANEAPVVDTSAAANLLLAEQVHADGYKVALTGEGSDEWLGGYPWLLSSHLLHAARFLPSRWTDRAIRGHLRLLQAPAGMPEFIQHAEKTLGGRNPWLIWNALMGTSRFRFYSVAMRERLQEHCPFESLRLPADRLARWHPLHRALCLGARTLLAGMLLTAKGDRAAMRSSVETRYPFLDEDVFTFLAGVDPRWKLRRFTEKYLLRKVAERWLPAPIAWRRKAMFRAPLDHFHTAQVPPFVEQLLSADSIERAGYFDGKRVHYWRGNYRRIKHGSQARTAVEMGLVGVVATQLWHQIFIDSSLADLSRMPRTIAPNPRPSWHTESHS